MQSVDGWLFNIGSQAIYLAKTTTLSLRDRRSVDQRLIPSPGEGTRHRPDSSCSEAVRPAVRQIRK